MKISLRQSCAQSPAQLQCCVYKLFVFCQFKRCADMLTSLLSIGPQSTRLRFDCCIYERYTPLLTYTFLAPSVPNQTAKTQSSLEGWKIGQIGWVGFIWLAHLSAGGMDEATFRFRRVGGHTVGTMHLDLCCLHVIHMYYALYYIQFAMHLDLMLFACYTYFVLYYVLRGVGHSLHSLHLELCITVCTLQSKSFE